MDVDRWGGKALNEVHDECSRRQNWLWLLYHTSACLDNLQIATGNDCKEALGAQTPQGYDPKRYIVLMKEAAMNARAADKSNGWFPDAGGTKMYELVDALMKFVSAKEYEAFVERKKCTEILSI